MNGKKLTIERQNAAQEYTRLVQSYISLARVAFNRNPYIYGEPVEESDFVGEGKND